MQSAWLLLVPVVVLRLVAPLAPRAPFDRWDAVAAILVGVAFALVGGFWLVTYSLPSGGLNASDFAQYCESVGAVQAGEAQAVNPQRSYFAALLPGVLARYVGIIGGLSLAALLSQTLLGTALYVWGHGLAGRPAAYLAPLFALTMSPINLMTRTATFYPQFIALCAATAAMLALALAERRWFQYLGLGVAAALLLVWDVRGLYWAAPLVLAGSLAACFPLDRHAGLRLGAVLLPVGISWALAAAYTPARAMGLGNQTVFFARAAAPDIQFPSAKFDFLWGRTPLPDVPAALAEVQSINQRLQSAPKAKGGPAMGWLYPWRAPTLALLVVSIIGLVRTPRALLALGVTLVPYATALYSAAFLLGHPRYLASGFPILAVIWATGTTMLLRSTVGKPQGGVFYPARVAALYDRVLLPQDLRLPLLLGLVALLAFGIVPSWLSPVAPWRLPHLTEEYPRILTTVPPTPKSGDFACLQLLQADIAANRTWAPFGPAVPTP